MRTLALLLALLLPCSAMAEDWRQFWTEPQRGDNWIGHTANIELDDYIWPIPWVQQPPLRGRGNLSNYVQIRGYAQFDNTAALRYDGLYCPGDWICDDQFIEAITRLNKILLDEKLDEMRVKYNLSEQQIKSIKVFAETIADAYHEKMEKIEVERVRGRDQTQPIWKRGFAMQYMTFK